jgi:hypothetical protein
MKKTSENDKKFVERLKNTKRIPPLEKDADRLRKIVREEALNNVAQKVKKTSR